MNKTKIDGVLLSLTASFSGATAPIFTKLILEYFSPQLALFFRMLGAFILISILLIFVIKPKMEINSRTLMIAFFGGMNFVLAIFGINYLPAVLIPVFYSLVPIEVTLFSFLLFKKRISKIKLLGIFIGYFGALIVLLPSLSNAKGDEIKPIGILLVMLASASIALFSIFIERSNSRYSSFNLSFQAITFALVFSIPMLFIESSSLRTEKVFNFNVVWFILGIAAIGTIMQYVIFQGAIAKIQASANVVFFYFQPFFVILMALAFLDETISSSYIIGLTLVLAGSSLNIGIYSKVKDLISNRRIIDG